MLLKSSHLAIYFKLEVCVEHGNGTEDGGQLDWLEAVVQLRSQDSMSGNGMEKGGNCERELGRVSLS